MDNQVKNAFGNRNNSEFVIDPEGKIIRARQWSKEEELRGDLEELVGKVEKRTTVAELNRKPVTLPVNRAASKLVPRVDPPSGSRVLKVEAASSDEPYYCKLRVDADSNLLRSGTGKMRIGFHIDPIHEVHWNNLAPPLKYSFKNPDDGESTVSPATRSAPQIEPEADVAPREFLVEVNGADKSQKLEVEVSYFPCHDVDKWCKSVTQTFFISLVEDRHAGRVQSRSGRGKGRMTGKGKGQGKGSPEMIFNRMDSNKDGKIQASESKGPMVQRFDAIDTDEDGLVTLEELKAHFAKRRR